MSKDIVELGAVVLREKYVVMEQGKPLRLRCHRPGHGRKRTVLCGDGFDGGCNVIAEQTLRNGSGIRVHHGRVDLNPLARCKDESRNPGVVRDNSFDFFPEAK